MELASLQVVLIKKLKSGTSDHKDFFNIMTLMQTLSIAFLSILQEDICSHLLTMPLSKYGISDKEQFYILFMDMKGRQAPLAFLHVVTISALEDPIL
jgi:hypothetical protein